jgi:hypothetical protein
MNSILEALRPAIDERTTASGSGSIQVTRHVAGRMAPHLQVRLVNELAEQMPGHRVHDYFRAKPEVLQAMDVVSTASDRLTRRYCGLMSATWIPERPGTLMLYTILVADAYQRGRTTFLLLQDVLSHALCDEERVLQRVVLKTAHPRSYRTMELFESLPGAEFFPSRRHGNSDAVRREARDIAGLLHPGQAFDDVSGVIADAAGLVPNDFYPELPVSSDVDINAMFRHRVGLRHRMLCVLELPCEDSRAQLVERLRLTVPKSDALS